MICRKRVTVGRVCDDRTTPIREKFSCIASGTGHNQPSAVAGQRAAFARGPVEVVMDRFIHNENIAHYRKLIALGEGDLARDEARHQMLLRLLAEEERQRTKSRQQSSLRDA